MIGCDRADQMIHYYGMHKRKTKKMAEEDLLVGDGNCMHECIYIYCTVLLLVRLEIKKKTRASQFLNKI